MSRPFVPLAFACLCLSGAAHADGPPTAPATPAAPAPGTPQIEEKDIRVVAPGVVVSSVKHNIPGAPLQLFFARVDPKAGGDTAKWKLKIVPADTSVLKAAPVSEMAKRENAVLAVNGGYFAFGGAALGAVKVDGQWLRLPWANRSAVAVDETGNIVIENLEANARATFGDPPAEGAEEGPGQTTVMVANLNGYAPTDGISILTTNFGTTYKLRTDEVAIEVVNDKVRSRVETGSANILAGGWTMVAHGAARETIADATPGKSAHWKIWLPGGAHFSWDTAPYALGAGPRLVKDGEVFTTEEQEEFKPDVLARGPRTAFGIDAQGRWIFLVVDGREKEYSQGLSIPELAEEMKRAGAVNAICLDGGGSSTMVADGKVVNKPSDGTERKVANAIVVVKADDQPAPPPTPAPE